MEIQKFLKQAWKEIPVKTRRHRFERTDEFGHLINKECLVIFKGDRESYHITDGGFVVAKIPKEGDLTKIGVFWSAEVAEFFADALARNIKSAVFDEQQQESK